MRANIASDLNLQLDQVSIKAKTSEKVGVVGREEAIVAEAVFKGWKAAIQDMRTLMQGARQRAMNQKH